MKVKFLVFFPAALLIAASSFGQAATPGVTKRQVNQQARIKEGVKSGELTKPEARRLETRQAKIQHNKKIAKSDGVVTPGERAKLHREENRASRAIHHQKHDAQTQLKK